MALCWYEPLWWLETTGGGAVVVATTTGGIPLQKVTEEMLDSGAHTLDDVV
jgi:hypothetical protein